MGVIKLTPILVIGTKQQTQSDVVFVTMVFKILERQLLSMDSRRALLALLSPLILSSSLTSISIAQTNLTDKPAVVDYTRNVDPFIGVDWGGNTFIGSTVPFGMLKVGPDMETFDGRRSGFGYSSHGVILGFSHLHLSGAAGKYGNILVAPVTGPLNIVDIKSPRTDEIAQVGYYGSTLSRYNVRAELTSSRRVGFHRYTFLKGGDSHVTVNLAAALGLGAGRESQNFLGAEAHVLSNREVQGVAHFRGGWNMGVNIEFFSACCSIRPQQPSRHGLDQRCPTLAT